MKWVLVVLGIVFVIIGHLGNGTTIGEAAFWLGIAMSVIGLVLEVHDEKKYRAFQ